ncbi:tol-pal system YbgF family protein [Roseateles sp. BYS78W]|uniref:Tol-pal system YbgF family protein n=1 Tax=Pelomonas candidula TaxID=3299025 RepID=A0ABW7HH33_9BURK
MRPSLSPHSLTLLLACGLAACAGSKQAIPPETPTLKTLAGRTVKVEKDAGVAASEEQTIAAYQKFLEVAPRAPQRAEALRRLGDLEMNSADNRSATSAAAANPDYAAALTRYRNYLKAYPKDPGNDRVLYQMARAYEQSGQLEVAMATLDRLVAEYPKTAYLDEAQFRRGEMLFTLRDYAKAEQAYGSLLGARAGNPFQERAAYMQGWSRFKQAKLEESLQSFFSVLDQKAAVLSGPGELQSLPGLTRAERELLEDTFRVTSISLANLQGADSIQAYITSPQRRAYEFRVYEQLGELYLKQERLKDAADTFGAFARREPLNAQAPLLQARVIDIYQGNGFVNQALDAKKDYVARYGAGSEFRQANPEGWDKAQPLVKTHLAELARHHHALAQQKKASADYQEAVHWYRLYLTSFPKSPEAAQNNFLLAELLYEDKRYAEAVPEYEKTAYQYPAHEKSADAGYTALLSYAALEKAAAPAELPALQKTSAASAQRFADAFPSDARVSPVLTRAAEQLYALGEGAQAAAVAQRVLALQPPAAAAQRRVAWTVVAHTAFERNEFDKAEKAYGEVLALTPATEPGRRDLTERLAASVYRQGEQARTEGRARDAVGHFMRVGSVAADSPVRATAQYDAAAVLIGLKDWDAAAATLEDFRTRFPKHTLQGEVSNKLAFVYTEKGNWAQAAGEYERLAGTQPDAKLARAGLWQSLQLREKAAGKTPETMTPAARAMLVQAYERYLKQYPQPLEPAVEARYRLAVLARADGSAARELASMKDVFQADQAGGAARTPRTQFLGAMAALSLAQPAVEAYRKVQLVEPLAKQLKAKKARMEEALKAYAVAADYGVADVVTAASYHTAALYQDFGKALLDSQRPKKLSKLELEQYNVMLEEQAYPFEEKATELHELNARRTTQGIYDEWVRKSFAALRELRPVRYGKDERSEGGVDAIR